MKQFLLLGLFIFICSAACEPSSGMTGIIPQRDIDALGGCYDPIDPQCGHTPPAGDSFPSSPGVYLGSDFTPAVCTGQYINDSDIDGFDDFCEFQLALSFRPLMSTDPLDQDLTRQPYWAVTWNGVSVNIIYMLSYYFDNGNQHANICEGSLHIWCWGHPGDSEFVIERVAFNNATHHWELLNTTTSAHFLEDFTYHGVGVSVDFTTTHIAGEMEYPTKQYHYPRIYVSLNKHANYNTQSNCNSGGFLDSDECSFNVDNFRAEVQRYRNVGATDWALITSATSLVNPVLYGGTEYYGGTELSFCGWDTQSGPNGRVGCSRSYFFILNYWGF